LLNLLLKMISQSYIVFKINALEIMPPLSFS